MKQSQNARKQRGRPASRKGGKSNNGGGNRNEPKVRGNPKQLLEKYKNQAREAKQAGDRVQAEYYYQFADHYQRILNEMNARSGTNGRDDSAQYDSGTGDEQGVPTPKKARPRRQRGQQPTEAEAQKPTEAKTEPESGKVDPADADQPVEVHPELDLDGTKVSAEETAEEKPKRRRAPARRRTPRSSQPDDAAPVAAGTADGSGDNEAA
jgi:hypothetical protein